MTEWRDFVAARAEKQAEREEKKAKRVAKRARKEAAEAAEEQALDAAAAAYNAAEQAAERAARHKKEHDARLAQIERRLDKTPFYCDCWLTTGWHLEKCRLWDPQRQLRHPGRVWCHA